MAACEPFTITVSGDPSVIFEKALKLAIDNGAKVEGDATGGNFKLSVPVMGRVAGSYRVNGQDITVEIMEKPFMLGCGMIESAVREQLRGR